MPLIDGLTAILEPGTVVRSLDGGTVELKECKSDMCVTVTGLPAVSAKIRMESEHHASKVRDGKGIEIRTSVGTWVRLAVLTGD